MINELCTKPGMFGGPRPRQVLWFERLFGFEESLQTVKEKLTCEKDETEELYYITGTNEKRCNDYFCCHHELFILHFHDGSIYKL